MEQLSEPFIEHLTRQRLVVGGNKDITWADVAASKATTVRDGSRQACGSDHNLSPSAMAKSLYVKVFDYVVELLNEKLQGDSAEEAENVNPNPQVISRYGVLQHMPFPFSHRRRRLRRGASVY